VKPGTPVNSTFTALKATLHFDDPYYAEVKLLDIFPITTQTLMKKCRNHDIGNAVGPLITLYQNATLLNSLVTGWLKEPIEKGVSFGTLRPMCFTP
jgi:hypothetical protein